MDMNRVIYFPSSDIMYGYNLDKIVDMEIPKYEDVSINDAIEFKEIKKYFDNNVHSSEWNEENHNEYLDKSKKLNSLSMKFFSSISDENIIGLYKEVDVSYRSCFWELFETCKLYNKISPDVFDTLIHGQHIPPNEIFKQKEIVRKYGEILRSYIFENLSLVRVVIHWYEQETGDTGKLYRPDEFTGEDVCDYLNNYIESDIVNINVLNSIMQMSSLGNKFPITDDIRLKAKRRYKEKIHEFNAKAISQEFKYGIKFSNGQDEEFSLKYEEGAQVLSYSTKWLLDTLDYPSILNNFIYIFEYVDVPQMRWSCVTHSSDGGLLDKALSKKSSKIYPCYTGNDIKNGIFSLQMRAYYNFLKDNNIRLEEVLEYFFNRYLKEEYSGPEIKVKFPSVDTSYSEKCLLICSCLESTLRQYRLFVNNGSIDFELLRMSSSSIIFKDIPSLIKNKYVYGVGEDFKRITFNLFSNQCMLLYIKGKKEYECLLDLLSNEKIYLSDYSEIYHKTFMYLKKWDIVDILENGEIVLKNISKILILKDLFENDVVSRYHYDDELKNTIKNMINEGLLIEGEGLLSVPEVNYLNYMLNHSEYNNGFDLRNMYRHGIAQPSFSNEQHEENYFQLLRMFILIVIKIKDDFEIRKFNLDKE